MAALIVSGTFSFPVYSGLTRRSPYVVSCYAKAISIDLRVTGKSSSIPVYKAISIDLSVTKLPVLHLRPSFSLQHVGDLCYFLSPDYDNSIRLGDIVERFQLMRHPCGGSFPLALRHDPSFWLCPAHYTVVLAEGIHLYFPTLKIFTVDRHNEPFPDILQFNSYWVALSCCL